MISKFNDVKEENWDLMIFWFFLQAFRSGKREYEEDEDDEDDVPLHARVKKIKNESDYNESDDDYKKEKVSRDCIFT